MRRFIARLFTGFTGKLSEKGQVTKPASAGQTAG
jgi:hypothetical protein